MVSFLLGYTMMRSRIRVKVFSRPISLRVLGSNPFESKLRLRINLDKSKILLVKRVHKLEVLLLSLVARWFLPSSYIGISLCAPYCGTLGWSERECP